MVKRLEEEANERAVDTLRVHLWGTLQSSLLSPATADARCARM
jgi:hypothetical protein